MHSVSEAESTEKSEELDLNKDDNKENESKVDKTAKKSVAKSKKKIAIRREDAIDDDHLFKNSIEKDDKPYELNIVKEDPTVKDDSVDSKDNLVKFEAQDSVCLISKMKQSENLQDLKNKVEESIRYQDKCDLTGNKKEKYDNLIQSWKETKNTHKANIINTFQKKLHGLLPSGKSALLEVLSIRKQMKNLVG